MSCIFCCRNALQFQKLLNNTMMVMNCCWSQPSVINFSWAASINMKLLKFNIWIELFIDHQHDTDIWKFQPHHHLCYHIHRRTPAFNLQTNYYLIIIWYLSRTINIIYICNIWWWHFYFKYLTFESHFILYEILHN